MRNPPSYSSIQITQLAAIGAGIVVAILLACLIGMSEVLLLIYFIGLVVAVLLAIGLQEKIWLLVPLAWDFATRTAVLGVPLSLRNCAVLMTVAGSVAYLIVSQTRVRWRWEPMIVLVFINLVYIGLTFMRNPTGLEMMGSTSIGGRPYIEIALAAVAVACMLWLPCNTRTMRCLPYIFLTGAAVRALLYLPAYFWPGLLTKFSFLYASIDLGAFGAAARNEGAGAMIRFEEWGQLGMVLIFVLCARYRPVEILKPWRWRFYLGVFAMAGVLLSGFRSYLLWSCMAIIIGAWLHRGWREAALTAALGALLLGALVVMNRRVVDLPLSAQRALSFLPGDWSSLAERNAEASSEWRFKMWESVLKEHMIDNWLLGDGFGFRAEVFESWWNTHGQGMELLTGAFHNGPLSAIRYAGIAGLMLLYGLMGVIILYAVRCVRWCRGSPLQTVTFFLAIQAFWEPIHYTLVFGQYDSQLPTEIMKAGCWLVLWRLAQSHSVTMSSARVQNGLPMPARLSVRTAV